MKGLKWNLTSSSFKRCAVCLLFAVSCLSSALLFSSSASAIGTNLQPSLWWAYGQSAYGAGNSWSVSASVGSSISYYNMYQSQIRGNSYSVAGSYVTISYSFRWTVGNVGYFDYNHPAIMGACNIGGTAIQITDRNDTWTTPANGIGGQGALVGYIQGTVDASASGAVTCTVTGVNGGYFVRRNQGAAGDPTNVLTTITLASATMSIESYRTEGDQSNALSQAQLEQMTNVNKNLVIVNQAINNAADLAHEDSQAQLDESKKQTEAIKNQTEQQQNQYDQDKKEESDRENQGKDDSEQAQGIFSFTFLNPFIGIFELFNPSGCVDIPIIAGMLNSEDKTYCPWFDDKTRNILTPVIGIFSMVILFGFVVGWLNGGDADGTIMIKK